MRHYIGVDWADVEHAVWVEDDTGAKILSRWLDERRAEGIELWAAIERPEGRVVDFLLDHGVVVFPGNPKALDRARDRFRMSGAKSDPFDARVAAGQTRLLNQLTITLKEYYPRALEVCTELKSHWARAFLRAYPIPAAVAALTERRWQRWARAQRLSAERAVELWVVLQRPQVPVPEPVVRVKSRLLGALVTQLEVTREVVEAYRQAIEDFFAGLPAVKWARRGHSHHHALRALGAKWLKILFAKWTRQLPYDEEHHLASIARHHLRQPA